jgi:hypothetical protein
MLVIPAGGASAASSNSAGTTHDKEIEHNGTDAFADVVPCHADLGGYWINTTYNSQFHDTVNKNGEWVTGTATGDFTAVPIESVITEGEDGQPVVTPTLDANDNVIPRDGESYAGHFQQWFGGSVNRNGSVFTDTFNIHGTGSEGTVLSEHFNNHFVFGPGEPFAPETLLKHSFNKSSCS